MPSAAAVSTAFRHLRSEDADRLAQFSETFTVEPAVEATPALSVVVPCYNESAALPLFMVRMLAACEAAVGSSYELLLINDGSKDNTWSLIESLSAASPRVVGINLARNHGHQLAVTAGLTLTKGSRVLIIDADLQDPPELLSHMMSMCDAGSDVIYGRRRSRAKESAFKLATANLFYRSLAALSEVDIPRDVGDFRLMTRSTVDRLNAMPEHDRFLRGMVAWLGGRQTELLYDRDPRVAGETGYSLGKMIKLAVAALTSFSTAPLKAAILFAFGGVLLGLGIVAYALTGYFTGNVNAGWTSLALMMVSFGIANLTCLAIIGAYVGRTYMQVKGRPLFMIDQIIAADTSLGSLNR
jgi:glycosyltransferase involved in cell wall biosynthesis